MYRLTVLCICASMVQGAPDQVTLAAKKLPEPRTINGEMAYAGQFPWQAALLINKGGLRDVFCSGSIISEEWILTSAQCIEKAIYGHVYTGSVAALGGTRYEIEKFILHEEYFLNKNNIGLVKLSIPLILDENTKIIRLGKQRVAAGERVTVSGWGFSSDGGAFISRWTSLNFINVIAISNDECSKYFSALTPDVLCTKSYAGEDTSVCNADIGGPLVFDAEGDPVLVGIVSFSGDCDGGVPSGYVRVSYYMDWIQSSWTQNSWISWTTSSMPTHSGCRFGYVNKVLIFVLILFNKKFF